MKIKLLAVFGALTLMAALVGACTTAPVTGRSQMILMSDGEAAQLGAQAFRQISADMRESKNPRYNQVVRRVGHDIVSASSLSNLNWQFKVFEDDNPNAFALPGGYIGVHTGMFKVATTDAQLAAVIGHEVGHVIARHGAESMSRQAMLQLGLGVVAGSANMSESGVQLMATAATLGVVLPFSRSQESESDRIGLDLMARAGYDPRAAVQVWQNMEREGGRGTLEFLSTHPSPGRRSEEIAALLPQVMPIYQASPRRR
ncbi:MAG: M48 family metallopeptidase [Alphaproteobacteria bacterium]|nr:M48 family metallopeptidase [Alphaproteobacteria bacterium]